MSTGEHERPAAPALTPLPTVESLPRSGDGYDADAVRQAFDAFRRHTAQLQAQLRVLQAASKRTDVEPTGHAVRMDALHLIRAAAEFADTLERDAQSASAAQLRRTEEEVRGRQVELQAREAELERFKAESERQRAEILNAAKAEARELLARANADATRELREAETRGARLLEQARHQATDLTNQARAEVEQTLEWARAQASTVMARAQQGVEQLLAAAGLGEPALSQVVEAILSASAPPGERADQAPPDRPVEAIAGGRPEPAHDDEPPVTEAGAPAATEGAPEAPPPPSAGPPPPAFGAPEPSGDGEEHGENQS